MDNVNLLSIWLALTACNFGFAALFGTWPSAALITISQACALMLTCIIRMSKS